MNQTAARHIALMALAMISLAFLFPRMAHAQNATATVTGTVNDSTGAPVGGALVDLRGPGKYSQTTDPQGKFSIANAAPGLYMLSVSKAGYGSATQSDVVLIAGQTQAFTIRINQLTFSSLREIGSVTSKGRGTFNTSPASVSVVTTQAFIDQAQPQVTRVLSQVPGLQISFPSGSANAAAPGSITIPNIRGATAYETASLIDGHAISVGQYGDNVTTFLNSFMFSDAEVIKGPGADSPLVNNAIGGTTNFRTKDPTLTPIAQYFAGIDNRGGTMTNVSYSNTFGRLGLVIALAQNNDPSALNGKQVYYDPSGGTLNGGLLLQGNATSSQVGTTATSITNGYPLIACCYQLAGNLDQTAELVKLRYKVSPVTTLTGSYLGGQSYSDQNGNTSALTSGQFIPGDPTYSGALKPGAIGVANIVPGVFNGEYNNEPIFQGELSTTFGKDTLLARYYHASILRYQFQGDDATGFDYNNVTLYGVSSGTGNVNQTFSGTPAYVGYADYYHEPELDKLSGVSFEWQHPVGQGLVTFSADRTASQSSDYSVFFGPFYSFNLPPGTGQINTTYMLRGHFPAGPRLDFTLSNYLNTYNSTYPVGCPPAGCNTAAAAVNGTGVLFGNTRISHFDPRLGVVYRPNASTAVRFAIGSSIAPPFLGLLSTVVSAPNYDPVNHVAIEQQSNGNLRPETAFGYDLGADVRLKDPATLVTGDVYYTNLFNRFFGQTVATGLTCDTTPCTSSGAIPAGTPILNETNVNISNARFEGIELALRHAPTVGFGYLVSGAIQKGYYYNLPPYFYCSIPGPGCTQNQNVNIIAGQNTNGDGIFIPGLGFSYNGNMRIPYSQGNAQLSYSFRNGAYALLGDTYYGNNNSLSRPAFGIGYLTLRYPLSNRLSLQLSGDNIFNAYPGFLPDYGGGVPIPLATGQTAATIGNVLGPATYRLVLSAKFP